DATKNDSDLAQRIPPEGGTTNTRKTPRSDDTHVQNKIPGHPLEAPATPGRLRDVELGRRAFAKVGCIACHLVPTEKSQAPPPDEPSGSSAADVNDIAAALLPLVDLNAKYLPGALRQRLFDGPQTSITATIAPRHEPPLAELDSDRISQL